ncbi:uncharacterized protein Z518_07584 [Rhinocladiella mackenziei CBS 650.93]|uniref:Uncharacterized protein n=1 Tax=Rhinocladiella mackenziei CBS 650.93 TaxID=1442369 RepID=A0A0D2ILH1_9EURO|nr:uncharacterized protein Z518_07584 [Rhinocladiella mackenziei CBS 650.93]KIX04031.1 hypothetical protein Z518_07584 [Rhinocladiella mackenziei CBS 650.93]
MGKGNIGQRELKGLNIDIDSLHSITKEPKREKRQVKPPNYYGFPNPSQDPPRSLSSSELPTLGAASSISKSVEPAPSLTRPVGELSARVPARNTLKYLVVYQLENFQHFPFNKEILGLCWDQHLNRRVLTKPLVPRRGLQKHLHFKKSNLLLENVILLLPLFRNLVEIALKSVHYLDLSGL